MTRAPMKPEQFLLQKPSAQEIYAALVEIGARDFYSFAMLCLSELYPAVPVMHNYHYEALAFRLDQVIDGRCQNLMINMPPRYGKSVFASIALPAYLLGHDPTRQILVISHSLELASKLSHFFRRIVNSVWYAQIFPHAKIFRDSELEVIMTEGGCRKATSITGGLTGFGGDPLIFDDPLNAADAYSDSTRRRVNELVRLALARRDDKKNGAAVIAMQRLHADDPCGSLLALPGNNWTVLSLAAIAEKEERIQVGEDRYYDRHANEALHAAREPIEILERTKFDLGSAMFDAQYQQNPTPRDGYIFKRDWIRTVDEAPPRNARSIIIQSWDTALKTGEENDYSAVSEVMVHGGHYYIIFTLRFRMEFPDLVKFAIELARRNNPTHILVEDSGLGSELVKQLQRNGLPGVAIKVERNKITRMKAQTVKFEAGLASFVRVGLTPEFVDEFLSVPNSRHDDQVDSVCQALAYAPNASTYLCNEVTNRNMGNMIEALAFQTWIRGI